MGFIIHDKNNYITTTSEGYKITNNISEAHKWPKIKSANNVVKDLSKNRNFKKYNLVVDYIDNNECLVEKAGYEEYNSKVLEKVIELINYVTDLEKRKCIIIEEIRNTDLEVCDLNHAAEFFVLNASKGYYIYKQMHEVQIKRRMLKDELKSIEFLQSAIDINAIRDAKRSIENLQNKKYKPRINEDLFKMLSNKK